MNKEFACTFDPPLVQEFNSIYRGIVWMGWEKTVQSADEKNVKARSPAKSDRNETACDQLN